MIRDSVPRVQGYWRCRLCNTWADDWHVKGRPHVKKLASKQWEACVAPSHTMHRPHRTMVPGVLAHTTPAAHVRIVTGRRLRAHRRRRDVLMHPSMVNHHREPEICLHTIRLPISNMSSHACRTLYHASHLCLSVNVSRWLCVCVFVCACITAHLCVALLTLTHVQVMTCREVRNVSASTAASTTASTAEKDVAASTAASTAVCSCERRSRTRGSARRADIGTRH